MVARKTTRVWVLYRANANAAQSTSDPGLELEGFATVRDAERVLGKRFALGHGTVFYVHPDRQADRDWTDWPDTDKATAHAEVWLGPDRVGVEPDATSQPDERWTPRQLIGVQRTRY